MLGEVLRRANRIGPAKEHYERAFELDASVPLHHIRLGGTYLLVGNLGKALQIFQDAAKQFPRNAEIHYFAAIAARGLGNYDVALAELRKSLALQPNSADALALSGAINFDRANTVAAEKQLRRALVFSPQHFNAHYDLGRLLVKSNRYAEALPFLEVAAKLQPTSPDVHYQIFLALSRLKRKADANRELELYRQLQQRGKSEKSEP
jgi:tetratricopeptide (TPR) repeat protein